MRVALLTDTHYGTRNDNLALANYFRKFYSNVFLPYLKENNITEIVHLGDMFCRRKYTNHLSLQIARDFFFDKLENINMHVIIGNHDQYYKNTGRINSPKLFLGSYKNITIHDSPSEVTYDGCKILLVPWICQESEEETMQIINATDAQICFGHLELAGFEMYKGSTIEVGYDPEIFSKFDMVCSGHFHHKSTRGNIYYLGCPYEQTWSDYGDQKGFHIFDTDTRSLTFIPNPYKLFNKIEYDDTDLTLEQIQETNFEGYRDTYIKLIVKNKTNPYFFDLILDELEKVEPISVQIIEERVISESDDAIIDEAKDTLTILQEYVEGLEGFDEKKQLNALLSDIYHEALRV